MPSNHNRIALTVASSLAHCRKPTPNQPSSADWLIIGQTWTAGWVRDAFAGTQIAWQQAEMEGGPNSKADGSHVSGNYRKGDRTIPSAKPEWAITVDPGRYLPDYEVDPVIWIRAIADPKRRGSCRRDRTGSRAAISCVLPSRVCRAVAALVRRRQRCGWHQSVAALPGRSPKFRRAAMAQQPRQRDLPLPKVPREAILLSQTRNIREWCGVDRQ
jgi:hypothetical protein